MIRAFPLLLFLVLSPVHAAWRDVYEATVRIERPGAAGSGVVFHVDRQFVWILTNAHVVGRSRTVQVVPFQDGKQLRPASGVVTLRRYDQWTDAAVVRVSRSAWPGRTRVVPLSLELPRSGQEIITVGCPRGDWPALWHGRVRQAGWPHFEFFPGRASSTDMMSGRSGSAICDAAGTRVLGLLTWQDVQSGNGKAQVVRFVIQRLWRFRSGVRLPQGELPPRLPEHLISACVGRKAIPAPQDTGHQTQAEARPPTPAGPLVPIDWDRFRKPDGTLPRTYTGTSPSAKRSTSWPPPMVPPPEDDCPD